MTPLKSLILLCVVIISFCVCPAWAQTDPDPSLSTAGSWPQWRGPGGMGVSTETQLPEKWGPGSKNIRWKTALPGHGVSSPIVSRGRVLLTTAFKSRQAARTALLLAGLGIVFSMTWILGWIWRWRTQSRAFKKGLSTCWPQNKLMWANEIFTLLVVILFGSLAFLTLVLPQRFDLWLDTVGALVARAYPDLEAIVTVSPEMHAGIWLTGGFIGLLGLAAATATLRGLFWRLLGATLTVICAVQLVILTPLDEWLEKIELVERLWFALPGVLLAVYVVLACFEIKLVDKDTKITHPAGAPAKPNRARTLKIRLRYQHIWHPGDMGTLLTAVSLAVLSVLVFAPRNVWQWQQGFDRAVLCLDNRSGDILWETVIWTAPAERKHSDNSYATPTPATDGEYILVAFGGAVACLDFEGKLLWRQLDSQYQPNSLYGSSSSPLIMGNLGIVLQGREDTSRRPAWLGAFDLATGQYQWLTEPIDIGEGYATPLVHSVGEKQLLLVPSSFRINAYDSDTGRCLWAVAIPIDQIVASLTKSDNILYAGGGTHGPKAIVALDLPPLPQIAPRERWKQKDGAPGCSSPVFYQGKLYAVTDTGLLSCFDGETGERLWHLTLGGRHLASLVAGDDKIYACSTRGRVSVFDTRSPRPKRLAQNELRGKCSASPALAEGCLFLRVGGHLYCIEGPV